jgi:hypothetical protein
MNLRINLNEEKIIIPNQICEGDNGEYLYIINKVGDIVEQNNDNDNNNNDNNNDEDDNILPIEKYNKSSAQKLSIILYPIAIITLVDILFMF